MKKPAAELTNDLMQKIGTIKLNDASSILGGSSGQQMLNSLRGAAADLQQSLADESSYEEIMEKYESLAGDIDTAGVTGLISESEMAEYYTLVDNIWAAIEREKDGKK